jgi:hypothetical protein
MMNFALRSISFHTLKYFFTFRKMLRHGADGFTYPPKNGVLRFFIVFKNSQPSDGIEATNLRSNCKHASHYTAEDYTYEHQSSSSTAMCGSLQNAAYHNPHLSMQDQRAVFGRRELSISRDSSMDADRIQQCLCVKTTVKDWST